MIVKELSNKQLVKGYREAKRVFRSTPAGTKEEITAENILNLFWDELNNRNLDLRNY
jgi:hypothetical protein